MYREYIEWQKEAEILHLMVRGYFAYRTRHDTTRLSSHLESI